MPGESVGHGAVIIAVARGPVKIRPICPIGLISWPLFFPTFAFYYEA
jgi:hypothetical protein